MSRITHVRIENFRVLREVEFSCDDLTLLVGMNNVGKTSVHEALRLFFSHDKRRFSADDRPHHTPDRATVVEVTFREPEGTDRVIRMTVEPEGSPVHMDVTDPEAHSKVSNPQKLATVIHIPAFQAVGDATKLTGPSALRDLLSRALAPAMKDKGPVMDALSELESSLSAATVSLESELKDELAAWNTTLALNVDQPRPDDLIKAFISPAAHDGGNEVKLNNLGAGLQRSVVYALISVLAKQQADDGESLPTLLLFEEPEVFLHPSQVDRLHRELRTLAETSSFQPIITTHSPRFLAGNLDRMTRVVRLTRNRDGTRSAQIDGERFRELLDQVRESFDDVRVGETSQPDEELDALRVSLLVDPTRGAAFFAQAVLLVEGQTEAALVARMIDDGRLELPGHVEVVDALGKFNFTRWMYLLRELNIPHAVLFDRDRDARKNKTDHRLLNQRIEEAARDTCAGAVACFDDDLESFLGVDMPTDSHRKPAALLAKYRDGEIDEAKLAEFCSMVSELAGRAA